VKKKISILKKMESHPTSRCFVPMGEKRESGLQHDNSFSSFASYGNEPDWGILKKIDLKSIPAKAGIQSPPLLDPGSGPGWNR
jgi:hypothetical protein